MRCLDVRSRQVNVTVGLMSCGDTDSRMDRRLEVDLADDTWESLAEQVQNPDEIR